MSCLAPGGAGRFPGVLEVASAEKRGQDRTDNWLKAAIKYLEYFPDQLNVTLSQQLVQSRNEETRLNIQKKILSAVIVNYYNKERNCLLTDEYVNSRLGIIELLGKR